MSEQCDHWIIMPDFGEPVCTKCELQFEARELITELRRIKAENATLRNWINDGDTNENLRDTILMLANQRDTLQARIKELEAAARCAPVVVGYVSDDAVSRIKNQVLDSVKIPVYPHQDSVTPNRIYLDPQPPSKGG